MSTSERVKDYLGRTWMMHLVGRAQSWHAYGSRRRSDGRYDSACTRRNRPSAAAARREFRASINRIARA